jgi:DNA-binding response OmpR family regulator
VTARLDGDAGAVEAALARAVGEAMPGAVDAFDSDLPRALLDAVGRVRVIDTAVRRLAVSAVEDLTRAPVVIDARTHELRTSAGTIALRGRPIVRRLLYALAARAGHALSKDALAAAAWEREYSPLVHDNPLKSNVGHLRRLVADAGLTVAADELGYRLELPAGAIFIDAV